MIGSLVAYYFYGQKSIMNAVLYAIAVFIGVTVIGALVMPILPAVTAIVFALVIGIPIRYIFAVEFFKQKAEKATKITAIGIVIDLVIGIFLAVILVGFLLATGLPQIASMA